MFLMDSLTQVLFYVFIVGSMLSIGLKAGKDQVLAVIRDKGWLARVFVANFVLIPAVGILAARVVPMKPAGALALIMLACTPGGLGALQYLTKKKDPAALAYAGGTTVLLSFLSVILSPVLIGLAIPKELDLTVPYGRVILGLSLTLLLPLLLGIFVHRMREAAAGKFAGPIGLIASLAFVGVVIKMLQLTKYAKGQVGKDGVVAIVVFILVTMLVGWLLGGPRRITRWDLALLSSQRFIALCLTIAVRSFADLTVLTPLVAFSAIIYPIYLVFLLVTRAAEKRANKHA